MSRLPDATRRASGGRLVGRAVVLQVAVGWPWHASVCRVRREPWQQSARQGCRRDDTARAPSDEQAWLGQVQHARCRATLDEDLATRRRRCPGVVQDVSRVATPSPVVADRNQRRESADHCHKHRRAARTDETQCE